MLQNQSAAVTSTYSRPASSHTSAPSPRTIVRARSRTALIFANGCQNVVSTRRCYGATGLKVADGRRCGGLGLDPLDVPSANQGEEPKERDTHERGAAGERDVEALDERLRLRHAARARRLACRERGEDRESERTADLLR